ncbi:MAG: hypothetical protein KF777_19380 [Planctomycetaceae bacterium]|nr:hypothetical protein [Planctomycetaceae bacterium]
MALEVSCGNCHGELVIERPNEVVACPHCGQELMLHDEDFAVVGAAGEEFAAGPAPVEESTVMVNPNDHRPVVALPDTIRTDEPLDAAESNDGRVESSGIPSEPVDIDTTDASATRSARSGESIHEPIAPEKNGDLADLVSHSHANLPLVPSDLQESYVDAETPTVFAATEPASEANNEFSLTTTSESEEIVATTGYEMLTESFSDFETTQPFQAFADVGATTDMPALSEENEALASSTSTPASPGTADEVVPKKWLIYVGSYACAVTLTLIYILFLAGPSVHELESLPDLLPPVNKDGEVGLRVAPPDADVAPGHVLSLRESRRFGDVVVTPLRVTRGPLQFVHYNGQPTAVRRPDSAPVLKLWLKFENVSVKQTFAPLDGTLVFKRIYRDQGTTVATNNFFCEVSQRRPGGELHHVFDMPVESEWKIAGLDLGKPLAPGESAELFIPGDEGVTEVSGNMVWRVQFRKGRHPASGNGVTTLIDVRFRSSDVVADAAGTAPTA